MYRVMVVDDEESVRQRLLAMIEKMGGPFEVVGSFGDAIEAEGALASLKPDLIITDVKMPYILGTDLIKIGKEILPLLESIIISGYDSFDYAQQAIALGVIAYLTKPLTAEDLKAALDKAEDVFKRRTVTDADFIMLRSKLSSSQEIVKENDIIRLFSRTTVSSEFQAKLMADGIHVLKKYHMVAVFDPDENIDKFPSSKEERLLVYFKKFFFDTFKGYDFSFGIMFGQQLAIFHSDEPFDLSEMLLLLKNLLAQVQAALEISMSCGVSKTGQEGNSDFPQMYQDARNALAYRALMGTGQVISYGDIFKTISSGEHKIEDTAYDQISYDILYDKGNEAIKEVNSLIDSISKPEFKDVYFFTLYNLMNAVVKSCISLPSLWKNGISEGALFSKVSTFKSGDDAKAFFADLISNVMKINEYFKISGMQTTFVRIKNYIDSNYTQSALSLDNIADELSFSVSYISSILKRNGISFAKYLTELRMIKAKELLSNPSSKIISIAAQVGYADPYYFSHCFKKYSGMSPDEYRKKDENKKA